MRKEQPAVHWLKDVLRGDAPQVGEIMQEGEHSYRVHMLIPQDHGRVVVELWPVEWERPQLRVFRERAERYIACARKSFERPQPSRSVVRAIA